MISVWYRFRVVLCLALMLQATALLAGDGALSPGWIELEKHEVEIMKDERALKSIGVADDQAGRIATMSENDVKKKISGILKQENRMIVEPCEAYIDCSQLAK